MKKFFLAFCSFFVFSSFAFALSEGELKIWINGDKGYRGLAKVGDDFKKDTGIKVVVEYPDDVIGKFAQVAAAGDGPDIIIWPHDRFGQWSTSGLLSEIKPSKNLVAANEKFTWDALIIGNKVYGYPIAIEAIGLIYNKKYVKTPPKNFKEIHALDVKLQAQTKGQVRAILWDYNNSYFTWPMLSASGGYSFKLANGVYNTKTTGVNNQGAIKGASELKKLIDQGLMPKGADYGVMDAAFNSGEVAMMINGPWSWANLEKSSIDFGVAPLPAVGKNQSKAFVGVLGAGINSASPNKDLAIEFLENYLLQIDGLKKVNADVPLGAVANKVYMKELGQNPHINATFINAKNGIIMPTTPKMDVFWSSMNSALTNITSGRQAPKEALDGAKERIIK